MVRWAPVADAGEREPRERPKSDGARKRIWLLQDGEPLPTDDNPRLMRTGTLAERLVEAGFDVTWWASSFQHSTKRYRSRGGRPRSQENR